MKISELLMSKKGIYIMILFFIAAFFLWRFIRPLNIFVVDENFERPIPIKVPQGLNSVSASECGNCHQDIYSEWSESMHAKAWAEPYFQVDYAYDGFQQICLNCHTPLENQQANLVRGFEDGDKFKPILKPNPNYDPDLRNEGVTCAVCHIREGKIIGPFETDNAPHSVFPDPEMTSGMKFCARCHVVSGKKWDTFYRIPPCGTVIEIAKKGQEPDCIGCHMPEVIRPMATGSKVREGKRHLFKGGHHPEMVKKALKVEYKKETDREGNTIKYLFTLTNTGAAHYLPTGTPDRHLTLELRLLDKEGKMLKEKIFTMKRHILWRPFIIELKDSRLPYGEPKEFVLEFTIDRDNPPLMLDITVKYHLLDDKRRKKIGYRNEEPIAYPVYARRIPL